MCTILKILRTVIKSNNYKLFSDKLNMVLSNRVYSTNDRKKQVKRCSKSYVIPHPPYHQT